MVATLAESLGTPLLPWQRHVADVAGEKLPDGSYAYQTVVVSVPRQTGKTTLIRTVGTLRALLGRDVFYTAQTGKDARARWMDLVKVIQASKALQPPRTTIALRGGSEHIRFPSGAVFQAFAPTPESLHGYTPPSVILDEAFAHNAAQGEALMGAIGPAQITVRDKQLWIVSTAGTAESTFLHDWIARAVEHTPRVAGFIWGAGDEHDPYQLDDIAKFHPGIGFALNGKVLTAGDVLAEADKNTRAEYERAYANRRTLTVSHLIPTDTWRHLKIDELPPPPARDLVLSYDVAADRQSATILATWRHRTEDGDRVVGKIVRHEPGVSWLVAGVVELIKKLRPLATTAVNNGPVLDITAQLRDLGHDIDELGERDYAAACGGFLSGIDDQVIGHDGEKTLQTSVTGLVTRGAVADGVAFSRRHSVGDSSAGIAFTAGAWTLQRKESSGKPVFYFKSA